MEQREKERGALLQKALDKLEAKQRQQEAEKEACFQRQLAKLGRQDKLKFEPKEPDLIFSKDPFGKQQGPDPLDKFLAEIRAREAAFQKLLASLDREGDFRLIRSKDQF